MKYIKLYEDTIEDRLPQVNDYIICKTPFKSIHQPPLNMKYYNFLNTHIGKITKIIKESDIVEVKYTNIPDDIKHYFFVNKIDIVRVHISNIIAFGKTQEDVEIKIQTQKYNL